MLCSLLPSFSSVSLKAGLCLLQLTHPHLSHLSWQLRMEPEHFVVAFCATSHSWRRKNSKNGALNCIAQSIMLSVLVFSICSWLTKFTVTLCNFCSEPSRSSVYFLDEGMEVSLDRRVLDGQVYQPICLCLVSTQPMFSVLQVTASVRSLSFLCSVYTCTY